MVCCCLVLDIDCRWYGRFNFVSSYAAIAMSTGCDCWETDEPSVTWREILHIFEKNAQKVTNALIEGIGRM